MIIDQKLQSLEQRFQELEQLIIDPKIISQADEYRQYSREHSRLMPLIQRAQEYRRVKKELAGVDELKQSSDPELQAIAMGEFQELTNKLQQLESELKVLLLPPDPNEGKDIIVEIRAGTGGEEAALFAGDLFRMYTRYAEKKGWKTEILDSHPTGLGGFKEVVFNISGEQAWRHFKYERGIHRVQRVPVTEASGRIHTSAVSVAVLPEVEDVDVELKTDDLRIDTYRSSGAGGQYVNKTESAIRITHIPTGIVVACQDERSQLKNRIKAFRMLRAKIYEAKEIARQKAMASDRRQQVGSGDRSEKIRTYNFPQNRITDHRIEFSLYRLKDVLEGDLDELVEKLIKADQDEQLTAVGQ
jgi:peptide chain release factor 1